MATQGGPAKPVTVQTSGPQIGGPAIPIAVVTDGRAVEGGPAIPIRIVTSGPVQGGPALPVVVAAAGAPVMAGAAIPAYVVSGYLLSAYGAKLAAMGPIALWPMDESSGSIAFDRSGNGRDGAYTGVTLGNTGIGDGRTSASFDGSTSFNNVYGASFAAAFDNQEGSAAIWVKMSGAGVWADGIQRNIMVFGADVNDQIYIRKQTTANQLLVLYGAGGTFKTVGPTVGPTAAWTHVGITWSKAADQFKLYINGAQSGVTQTGLGVWVGALNATTTLIGAQSTTPTNVTNGFLSYGAVFARVLSAAEMLAAATV